jgi:hypothetical protein
MREISEQRNYEYSFGEEVARECPYPLDINAGYETQKWIIDAQVRMEQFLDSPMILDRAIFDTLAYIVILYKQGNLTLEEHHELSSYIIAWINNSPYTTIFYHDPLSLVLDDKRITDKEFQLTVDKELRKVLLEHCKCDVITIDGTPKERANKIFNHINRE